MFCILLMLFFVGISQVTIAQNHLEKKHERCSNHQLKKYLEEQFKTNPELKRAIDISKAKSKEHASRLKSAHTEAYVIPIVFHIIHNYGVENVSDAKIYEALEIINKDYSAINEDIQDLKAEFQSVKGNPNVVFKLAQIDPDGNPTTGITRTVSALTVNGSWDHPEVKRLSSWPREKYLNIWVVRSSNGSNGSAWAYLPYQVDNEQMYDLDGIIISSWALGATTPGFHRILTHEIGHFLNLHHTWSPWAECGSAGSCNEDDGVADTPNCSGYSGGCDINHSSCGSLDMVQNYMDYSMCPVAFTKGQAARMHNALNSDISDRNNLWSESNLKATLFTSPTPRLLCVHDIILESKENNGAFSESFTIELLDAEFENEGQILSSSDYSFTGIPLGLTPQITVKDSKHLQIELVGQTANHDVSDNTDQISFHFNQSVLKAGSSSLFNPNINTSIKFRAPYQIVYTDCDDITISASNAWQWINLGASNANFGIWHENGKLRIETYEKAMICENTSRNISVLEHGEIISKSKNWIAGAPYPDEHDLLSESYSNWKGKIAYAAIQFPGLTPDETLYGWMRLSVSEDGNSFSLLDYAFNEAPEMEIIAGQKNGDPVQSELIFDQKELSENYLLNDGSIENEINITLMGNSEFTGNGLLSLQTHYNITNLPSGLNPEINVISAKKAVLTIKGNAASNEKANSKNITLEFMNQAFKDAAPKKMVFDFSLSFNDSYQIIHKDIADISVTPSFTWQWFSFGTGNSEFGAWHFENGHLKLETYGKEVICQPGTRNILPLDYNTKIDANNSWTLPGAYPNQLDIRTSSYHNWEGRNAYIGVCFNTNGYVSYGWIRAEVAADGTSWKVLEWAYNQAPNEAIYAGQTSLSNKNKLVASSNILKESWTNDGSISSSITLELLGASFAKIDNFTEGTHYNIQNLPAGLQCQIRKDSDKQLSLVVNGAAQNHAQADHEGNFTIEFTQNAFSSSADDIEGLQQVFDIQFKNPYEIVYVDCDDMLVDDANPWTAFTVKNTGQEYGIWMDKGNLRFETYSKPIICQQGTTNIIPLEEGYRIDANAMYWEAGGEYPDEHFVVKNDYTTWAGKTAFIGFSFTNEANLTQYGWFRVKVASTGTSYQLLDYAYHEGPNLPIFAGSTDVDQNLQTPKFTASAVEIEQNGQVHFTNKTINPENISEWIWTFEGGDPSTYKGQNPPAVTYNQEGTFTVSLSTTDVDGNTESTTKNAFITVIPLATTEYCIPTIEPTYNNLYITQVQINKTYYKSEGNYYNDFTDKSFTISTNSETSIQITPNINWSDNHITAWIDWNADGIFDDVNEKIIHLTNGSWNESHPIQIPKDIAMGKTRMRVRISYYKEKSPCESETYMGEVEDYSINLVPEVNYCIPDIQPTYSDLYITKVQIDKQANESGEDTYSDFTATSFNLSPGTNSSIQVTPSIEWSKNHITAWIDWNQDGIFDDTNEDILHVTDGNWSLPQTFQVPTDVITGETRMRVRISYYTRKSPCQDEDYMGEIEDYAINISGLKTGKLTNHQITEKLKEISIKVYPIPATNVLKIESPLNSSISLYDIKGRLLLQESATSTVTSLQVTQLKSGFYIVKITTPNGTKTRRIVIQ